MSNPTWPATLPPIPLIGWSQADRKQYTEWRASSGPRKLRLRQSLTETRRKLPIEINTTQMNILLDFVRNTLFGGVLRFDFIDGDTLTGTTVTYRFMDPSKFQQYLASKNIEERRHNITLDLEVMNAT